MATRTGSRSRRAEQSRRLFLRLHNANERRFARAVAKFFREQGQRLIHALAGVGNVVHRHDIDAALNWEAEHERFIRTVARPQLLACATTAALVALQTFRAGNKKLRLLLGGEEIAIGDDATV